MSCLVFLWERLSVEKWTWYKRKKGGGSTRGEEKDKDQLWQGISYVGLGKGQHRCNDDRDRHQTRVMLHQLRSRGANLKQKNGAWNSQGGKKSGSCSCSAGLIYSFFLPLVGSSTHPLHRKMQSGPKPRHCTLFLTTGCMRAWQQQTVEAARAMRQELVKHEILPPSQCTNKTWLRGEENMYGATTLSRSLSFTVFLLCFFLVFQRVWPMLISHCQDSSPHVERTKGRSVEVGWKADSAER